MIQLDAGPGCPPVRRAPCPVRPCQGPRASARWPSRSHGLWGFLSSFNLNTAGFVIVAMFIVARLAAMLIWRYGQIEEKWTARLQPGTPGRMVREPPAAEGGEPLVIYSVCNNPGGA
jgi:hypothetical protein